MSFALIMAGFGLAVLGSIVGYFCRSITRQGLVFRCPIWVGMIVTEIALVTLGILLYPMLLSVPVQAAVICLILGYPVGYSMADPGDNVSVDLIDEYNNSEAGMIFYYYHNGGRYMMPQTFMGCLLSLMGARWPLTMDLQFARRTRSHSTSNRFWSVSVNAYVAQSHLMSEGTAPLFRYWTKRKILDDGTIVEIPKYLFYPRIEDHEIYFAESAVEDPNTFMVKTDTYHEALAMAVKEKGRSTRVTVEANNAAYGTAAKVLQEMFSLNVDGPEYVDNIRERMKAIRNRRGGEDDGDAVPTDRAEDDAVSE